MAITVIRRALIKELTGANLSAAAGIQLSQLTDGEKIFLADGTKTATADLNLGAHKLTGVADAVAGTDAPNKAQVEAAITAAVAALPNPMEFKGAWDPNSGALPATIDNGDAYVVEVAGTFSGTAFQVGSQIIAKSTKTTGITLADFAIVNRNDSVVSVAGKTGPVTLEITDINGLQTALAGVQSAINFVDYEVPTGAKDGSNTTFTLAHSPVGESLKVVLGGAVLTPGAGNDYLQTGTSIVLAAELAPAAGENFWVFYRY